MVELRKITDKNYRECLELKVREDQAGYVASNLFSLAQAWVYYETAYPFAVYADDVMVGFIMMGYDRDKKTYDIWRLMIDRRYQGNGYGKAALLLGVGFLSDKYKTREIYLSFVPENSVAEKLYESAGFRRTGEMDGGEAVMRYMAGTGDNN